MEFLLQLLSDLFAREDAPQKSSILETKGESNLNLPLNEATAVEQDEKVEALPNFFGIIKFH